VFVAGNFGVSGTQSVTLPSGTWYNCFEQKQQSNSNITLAPGEVAIFTGNQVTLPTMPKGYAFNTDVENVFMPDLSIDIAAPYNVTIYTVSGQAVSIQRNVDQVDMTGLHSGLYLLQYEKNGQRVTKKVIR
jgi:hypothetical protein